MACCPKKDKHNCCPKNSFLDVPAVSLIAADCGQHGMALGIIEPTSTLHMRSSSMATTLLQRTHQRCIVQHLFIEQKLNLGGMALDTIRPISPLHEMMLRSNVVTIKLP